MKKQVITWLHTNLFSTWYNTILTLVCIYILYLMVPPILSWAIFNANILGDGPEACTGGGACWVFIKARFNQFMFGFYPRSEQWRILASYFIFSVAFGYLIVLQPRKIVRRSLFVYLLLIHPILSYILFIGGRFGLPHVATNYWGGLFLTLVLAYVCIIGSIPLGTVLALGRRSKLPVIKLFSTMFIELWRGVPLISVLFMSSVLIPIFLPEELNIDKLLRALIGMTMFFSAYMAEVVRGGLQAIPRGQFEAAKSIGLSYWPMMYLIILPQAFRLIIPGIVNTTIALFKDSTLVLIISLFDLLGIVQAAFTDPKWIPYNIEGYVFAGFTFWIFCFGMSRYSMAIEKKLNVGN